MPRSHDALAGEALAGAALVAAIADPAVVVDAEGRPIAWNRAAQDAGLGGEGTTPGAVPGSLRVDLADGGVLHAWPTAATVGDDEIARQKARILEHLAPGVAHDLVNQVGGIQSFLQVAHGFEGRDRQLLDESAANALGTVRAFQDLVRTRRTGPAEVDLGDLVARALAMATHALHEVTVSVDVARDLPPVRAEPGEVRQALLAVIVNALDALGWPVARGELGIVARRTATGVAVSIEDDATPVPPPAVPHLFDPRPPAAARRAPLDLAVARHLARAAGGDLRAEAAVGRGNRFVLELPAATSPDPVERRVATEPAVGASEAAVLVCDDDEAIRALIVRVLRREGVEAIGVPTADAALAAIDERPVGLVIAGHDLGATSGPDLYLRIVGRRPDLRGRFVLISGDGGHEALAGFAREHGLPVIEKPFDVNELATLVRQVAAAR